MRRRVLLRDEDSVSEPTRPRVLHIVDTLGMGGAETWLIELLRLWAWDPSAPQMDILATSGNRGLFDDEAEALGAKIFYVPFGRSALWRFARDFRRILEKGRYAALHDHQDYAAGWHFLLGLGVLPTVRVAHVHSPWIHISADYAISLSRKAATAAGKLLVQRLATDVTGTSAEVLRMYGFEPESSAGPRVAVVHCGINIDKFSAPRDDDRRSVLAEFGWPPASRLVLFAGRLDRALEFGHPQNHKNSWLALHIARAAAAKDPSLRLLMAGAGDEPRRGMTDQIREWGLAHQLRLIGVREDMPRLMRAADVLLFPSQQEGLGMVAVEAQAAGLPVLASTAVPRECIVLESLYHSLELDRPAEAWADKLVDVASGGRPDPDVGGDAVRASAFSITSSAAALRRIYGG